MKQEKVIQCSGDVQLWFGRQWLGQPRWEARTVMNGPLQELQEERSQVENWVDSTIDIINSSLNRIGISKFIFIVTKPSFG